MSKFTIKVELQGLKIEVEGTKEDAPRIARELGKQFGGLLQSPAVLASGNGSPVLEGEVVTDDGAAAARRKKPRKSSGGGGSRTSTDELNFVHDSAKYGAPLQSWTQAQKAIWFLYIVGEQAKVTQQTAYGLMKGFNKYFKAAGQINNGNVMTGLEKEKLKGANATVGTDVSDGTAKYFLTQAGIIAAQRLAKGEAISAE
jgi:hypothetical protein